MLNIKVLINKKSTRFLIAGSTTFLCEYIVFYVFYELFKWNLLLSNSLSFVVGLSVSFILNKTWAFNDDEHSMKVHHQITLYIVLAASNLVVNNLIVSGLKGLGIDPRIGKVVAIMFIAISNFNIYKYLIFKTKRS